MCSECNCGRTSIIFAPKEATKLSGKFGEMANLRQQITRSIKVFKRSEMDVVPQEVLHHAKGIVFFTEIKGGNNSVLIIQKFSSFREMGNKSEEPSRRILLERIAWRWYHDEASKNFETHFIKFEFFQI